MKSTSPGLATRFGWQFPHRPQLPDFEQDTSSPERSPSPVHRPTSRIVASGILSHIPVRSPGQVPKVAIKRSGDGQTFTKGHKRATTEFSEANGAVPPKIHLPEPELASESESMDATSLRGLSPPRFLSRKSFSCFIFPGSDDSIQDAPTPIARPIEIPPPFSPIRTVLATEDPDSDASSPPAATTVDAAPSFELSTPPRPLSPPRSNLRHHRRPKASPNSLVRPHLPKMKRRASILCPQIVKMMFQSASRLQRHLVCPVGGLQLLPLHDRRLPSPLLPRSPRPSCRMHDPIRFLRLPSRRSNFLLQDHPLRFPTRAHCPYEHPRLPGAGFLHLALFVGRAC